MPPRRRRPGAACRGRSHGNAQPLADGVDADEPQHALALVDDDPELDRRAKEGGERVAQRRLAASTVGAPGVAASASIGPSPVRSAWSIHPSGRSSSSTRRAYSSSSTRSSRARTSRRSSPARTGTASISSRSPTRASERRLRPRSAPTKRSTNSRGGVGEDGRRRVVLGQDAAALQDRDAIAHLDRLVDVVGDEDDRLAHLLLEAQELVLEAVAADRVDRAERLVHEHDRRIGGQRPGDADPLALSTGQLVRVSVAIGAGLQADQLEQLVDALADACRLPAQQLRDDGHVVADRLVRKEPDLLDHVADAAAQLDRRQAHDVLAADGDAPARRLDEPVHHLHAGRLAAAGRADQDADLAGRDGQAQVVDRRRGVGASVALGDVLEGDDRAGGFLHRAIIGSDRHATKSPSRNIVVNAPRRTSEITSHARRSHGCSVRSAATTNTGKRTRT